MELVYRPKLKAHERPTIQSAQDAYDIFLEHWNPNTIELLEEFKLLLVNRAHRVLGILSLSTGGTCMAVVDAKLVFVAALKGLAAGIILCHNHPSQNLTPSEYDRKMTEQIREAGKLLGIKVLDHLIISPHEYYSFSDEGLLYSILFLPNVLIIHTIYHKINFPYLLQRPARIYSERNIHSQFKFFCHEHSTSNSNQI